MAVIEVRNLEGNRVGEVEVADSVFAARVNPNLLHEVVRWYRASERAGTHKTKGRGEVAGSGRKLWRQKGTGRARVGSIRSSIWRKGGTVHGPQPRSHAYRVPRKMVLGALRSALSSKLAENKLTVVDLWSLASHKTKEFDRALARLDGERRTVLLVNAGANRNLELASRNLEGVKLVAPSALQAYDLLRHERVMLSKEVALHLSRTLDPERKSPEAANGSGAEPQLQAAASPAPKKRARKGSAAAKPVRKPSAARKRPAPKADKEPGS